MADDFKNWNGIAANPEVQALAKQLCVDAGEEPAQLVFGGRPYPDEEQKILDVDQYHYRWREYVGLAYGMINKNPILKDLDLPHESDPSGLSQHEPGAKNDKGKVRVGLVFEGFARALWAVCEVGTEGAAKYSDNGWLEVEAGKERYTDAQLRHFLKGAMGEEIDPDFDLLHMAHEAWNSLAKLELKLRETEAKNSDQG